MANRFERAQAVAGIAHQHAFCDLNMHIARVHMVAVKAFLQHLVESHATGVDTLATGNINRNIDF